MDAVPYTDGFKQQMVRRMLGPQAVTAHALARQVGVPQPTLSRWLRDTATLAAATSEKKMGMEGPPTVRKMLHVVVTTDGLDGEALGELLCREGCTSRSSMRAVKPPPER